MAFSIKRAAAATAVGVGAEALNRAFAPGGGGERRIPFTGDALAGGVGVLAGFSGGPFLKDPELLDGLGVSGASLLGKALTRRFYPASRGYAGRNGDGDGGLEVGRRVRINAPGLPFHGQEGNIISLGVLDSRTIYNVRLARGIDIGVAAAQIVLL